MSETEHSQSRGVVAAPRLEPDETRLNNIDPSDTVAAGNLIESLEDLERTSDSLAALHLELDRDALPERDRELGRDIRGVEGVWIPQGSVNPHTTLHQVQLGVV